MVDADSESRGRRKAGVVAAVVAAGVAVIFLGLRLGWFPAGGQTRVVVLYCFSTLDDVMQDRLLPAFQERWQQEQGEVVEFVVTFAGSGDITRRILAEFEAEIAIVSSELDAHRLPAPFRSWQELPQGGVLASTPLVIVTREGNPKGIRDFQDLTGEGIALLHGDPATSGAAELAILAEYGSAMRRSEDSELAFQQLLGIWRNVAARPATAREARRRFEQGEGDAFVTYYADVAGSPSRGQITGEIVFPASTIVAEPVVVKIEKNIDKSQRRVIDAFVEFLWGREAQEVLADYGFQSVAGEWGSAGSDLAAIEDPFTLDDLGGLAARRQILEGVWTDRVVPQLKR